MEAPPSTDEVLEIIKLKKFKIQKTLNDLSNNPPSLREINDDEDFIAMRNLLSSGTETLKGRGPTAELWIQYLN